MALPTHPGDVIAGKYRVERVLGTGGMGIVVEATHLTLDEKVAIKFLKPEALENSAAVARFAREAKAAAKIKSEHVCRVLDVVVDGGMPYLVMEYLEGRDLDDLVEKSGGIPVEDAVDYILQACEALAEAHVAGIVHRDLKPANLFLARRADGSPIVKVLDFGISKIQLKPGDAAMTATTSLLGSPLYMSPEQMKATRDVDARTDIWSVGVILYEILTGDRPFSGETIPQICANILSEPPAPMRVRVPQAIQHVVFKCLEKRPDQRYQTVADLAEALRPLAPARAHLSIDRVTRVIGSASGGVPRTAPAPQRPSAPGPAAGVQAWSSPTLPADSGQSLLQTNPPVPAERSGAMAASGEAGARPLGLGTNATFEAGIVPKPRNVARIVLVAGAAVFGIASVTALMIFVRHPRAKPVAEPPALAASAPAPTPPPAPSDPPIPPPPAATTPPAPEPAASASASAAPAPPKVVTRPALQKPPPPPPPKPTATATGAPKQPFGGRD